MQSIRSYAPNPNNVGATALGICFLMSPSSTACSLANYVFCRVISSPTATETVLHPQRTLAAVTNWVLQRTITYVKGAARDVVSSVKESVLQKSDPKVDELLNALKVLQRTQAAPQGLKKSLKDLIRNPQKYFGDAYKGIPPVVRRALSKIMGKITANAPFAEYQNELERCIQFLAHVQSLQMGWIQYALSLPSDEGLAYFFESMGLKRPAAAAEAGNHHDVVAEAAQRKILQSMAKPKVAVPVPEAAEYRADLSNKLDQTRDTALKMFLTQLVFGGDWKKTFCKIHSEAQRRVSSGTGTDFDVAFGKVFEENFFTTSAPKSTVERIRYWFHLTVTARLLRRYGKEVMDHFKADLFRFLDRTPEERISDVFATVIKPLHEHMSGYYSFNERLALPKNVLNTSIDRMNEAHFDALVVNGETIDHILIHFAHILVEKYTPKISWSDDLEATLNRVQNKIEGIYSSTVTNGVLTVLKVSSVWSCFLFSWAIEKAINVGLKWKIKRVVRIAITSNLYKTGDTAGKTHSRVQHLINQFLMEKLTGFNANGKGPERSHAALRSSPTTRREIEAVVDVLFSNIPLSMATNNPADLREFFHGGAISKGKQDAFNLFKAKFTPTVSLEILRGMEHFFYDDERLLSEFVWYTANNIAETMTTDAGDAAQKVQFQAVMNATENEMHKQLRMAVKTAVREGVQTALDPSKKYQRDLDASMEGLRNQTAAFLSVCDSVDVSTSDKIGVAWGKLAQNCARYGSSTSRHQGHHDSGSWK
jgi:hypothetical protein